jgi:hypothetical protein
VDHHVHFYVVDKNAFEYVKCSYGAALARMDEFFTVDSNTHRIHHALELWQHLHVRDAQVMAHLGVCQVDSFRH